jgi:TolB protein
VPWARIGSGWTLATWSASGRARATLFLIDARGNRYAITRLAKRTAPLLWSPDGKRVLVSGPHHLMQVTLRTGAAHRVNVPEGQVVTYSRPKGLALIEAVDVPHGQFLVPRLERFGTDGQHQLTYPKSIKRAGVLDTNSVLETADGAQLVVGARHGLVLLRNNGTLVRRLHATSARCMVASWWRKDVALAQCGNGALWAVPISGAHDRRLTESTSKEDPFGYSDAWRYTRGRLGLAPNGCGPESLVRFTPQGHGNRIDVPSPTGHVGRSSYIGHHGNLVDMLFVADRGCQAGKTVLFAYNAVKRTSTALLGPTVNGGSVISAIPYATDK